MNERNDWTAVLISLLLVAGLVLLFVTVITSPPASYHNDSRICIALVGCNGE